MLKPDPLSYPPRGLNREEAARYLGIGTHLFDDMVADHRMPKPKRINKRVIWDRVALDIAFSELPTEKDGLQALLEASGRAGESR